MISFISCVCMCRKLKDRERELLLHTIFCLTKFDLVYYDQTPGQLAY